MYYIIDANNLAGELRLLKQKEFDQEMIRLLDCFAREKKKKVIAVFDGRHTLGERFNYGALQVEYAPHDKFYTSADDKIVDVARKYAKVSTEELVVVTNDRELQERIELLNVELNKKIGIMKATDFAQILKDKKIEKNDSDDGLEEEDEEEINQELLNLWK